MNTNPKAIRILCYGDSNTWGDDPRTGAPRYAANVRWPGVLQDKLGQNFEIIEEGLCGRTTVLDDPKESDRNGKTYLEPCLKTHQPIDIVILMLGTNDLKERFNLSAEDISKNIEQLILIIKKYTKKIILLSPALVNENIENSMEGMKGAEGKSRQFAKYYQIVAEKHGCEFINIAEYVNPSPIDGCHLSAESHSQIAKILTEQIIQLKS
jgi:lysophospholipase L1-like esterase